MVAYVFDRILAQGARAGQIPARTQQARSWFRDKAADTRITPNRIISTAAQKQTGSALTQKTLPGRMYAFFYDPKHKKTLPYYDRFPLIFKIANTSGGFYGMNLHYLPPTLRAKLMDALYTLASDTRYDENTRLQLSYEMLNKSARFKFFKPTVKKYLNAHVKSRFVFIDATEWDIALFLPTERFVKSNKNNVWRESRRMV